MGDLMRVMSAHDLQNNENQTPAYVVLTLIGRDIDGSRVIERHSYINDLCMSKRDIVDALRDLPITNVDCQQYGLPAISLFDPDDESACGDSVDIDEITLLDAIPRGVDGEDVLSSLIVSLEKA